LIVRHANLPERGPPAYNAKPSADVELADGVRPLQRAVAVDGPLIVVDDQPGWRAPVPVRRDVNGPMGPVAHRQPQMDGDVPSMARRRFVAIIV